MTLELSKYTIMKASAGSGKTYRLTQEITQRLGGKDGAAALHPEEIIATTFTRKAAGELRHRVREHLVEAGQLTQAAAMPAALVGTVNSVTGRILQDFAMDVGLSPDLNVLTQTSQEQAFRHATDEIIAAAEQQHRALLFRMRYDRADAEQSFFRGSSPRNWGNTIRELIDLARSNDLAPDAFAEFGHQSIDEVHALLAEPDEPAQEDARSSIIAGIRATIQETSRALDAGEIAKRSVAGTEKILEAATAFVDRAERVGFDQLTWKEWSDAADGKFSGVRIPAGFGRSLAEHTSSAELLTDPRLRDDLAQLVEIVFATAAQCMAAYQEYKDALGLIDFIDQEHRTLELLRTHDVVRTAIAQRYRVLAVDEFQDTSPLQLALFTELAKLVDDVIWVGDPKQSIYRFRGSDPALMQAAIDAIEAGGGHTEILDRSWRTHEVPLDFSNQLFSQMFPGIDPATGKNPSVWLEVAEPRKTDHAGGAAELWRFAEPKRRNNLDWQRMIACGILDLKLADPNAGSIAVLTRTNYHAEQLQHVLIDQGLTVTGGGTPLLTTREGAVVRAAIAWLLDDNDTQALVELILMLDQHSAHADWLAQLTALETTDQRRDLLRHWGTDVTLAPLEQVRQLMSDITVPELVEAVIDALDLRTKIAAWDRAESGSAALVGLLGAAQRFVAEDDATVTATTAAGFLDYLAESDDAVTQSAPDPNAVYVGTVHQAKGLEWDTVIVALPDHEDRLSAAGQWVHVSQAISLDSPLAGRQLRFWPETLLDVAALKTVTEEHPDQLERQAADQFEQHRLLYVAMTRSVYRTVLAPRSDLHKLSAFADGTVEVAVQDPDDGSHTVNVKFSSQHRVAEQRVDASCDVVLDCRNLPHSIEDLTARSARLQPAVPPAAAWLLQDRGARPDRTHRIVPAKMVASHNTASEAQVAATSVELVATLGDTLVTRGGRNWNLVGDCVHAYLALPYGTLDHAAKHRIADRLVQRFGLEHVVTADVVVEAGERWSRWHDRRYPEATVQTEVPFSWLSPRNQRVQGFLDQLTIQAGDYIVTDHKSYPGTEPVETILAEYTGQLDIYRRALHSTIGALPTEVLVHMPLRSEVYAITLPD